jgi:glycosyltransferase involved in cell wall biosynthesis
MLSIIIPTLNEEKYLPLLLEEIKKQKFKDLEIIIADAGSKDKTLEIAKSYGCKIVPGGLPAKGRNEGVKAVRGDTLLFLDADNIHLPPNFLETLLAEFEKRNLKVASFPIFPKGNWFDKIAYGLYNFWAWLSQRFLPHATNSVLIKKGVHEKIGGFDEEITIAEDHFYARQAAKIGKYGFIKTKPVLTSCRRFERDGRFVTYSKYLIAALQMLLSGRIKSNFYHYYHSDHHSQGPKN